MIVARTPTVRPATVLAVLGVASGIGWLYWTRVQPVIDAETARRLRVGG